jgi:hypothetical protein
VGPREGKGRIRDQKSKIGKWGGEVQEGHDVSCPYEDKREARASAAGGGLEPLEGFAPGGGATAAHGGIQPDN